MTAFVWEYPPDFRKEASLLFSNKLTKVTSLFAFFLSSHIFKFNFIEGRHKLLLRGVHQELLS